MISQKNFEVNPTDILSGQYDDYFKVLNLYSDTVDQFTPFSPHLLSQSQYQMITNSVAQMPYIVSSWQSNVGQNGSSVMIAVSDNNSDIVRRRKELIKKRTYSIIYTKHKWKQLELEIVKLLAKEGNAVVMLNDEGKFIVESIFRFNVYPDHQNKRNKYAYKFNGHEVAGMKDLKHGEDLFHIKDPVFLEYPVAPSRIDAALAYILLENKAIRLNTHLFANGWFTNIFLKLNPQFLPKLMNQDKDKEGKTWWQRFMDDLNDKFRGVLKAGRIGYIPGLEDIIDVNPSNKDAQFQQLLKELTPERLAWAYSMNQSNMGTGPHLTENNASTFDDALYDKFGRPVEHMLDECRNEFMLWLEGISTSEDFYIQFNAPEDPNKLEQVREWREDWKFNSLTLNEYRDLRGLPPIEGGDVTYSEWMYADMNQNSNTIDAEFSQSYELPKKLITHSKKNLSEKAIDSKRGKKFKSRWNKAINNQLKDFLKDFESIDEDLIDLDSYEVVLPKIESYYAFNVLKDDLLYFAGLALDSLKKDKRVKMKKEYFDGEYPQVVLDSVENRTEMILKGLGDYAGVDSETTAQINTIIANNASKGVAEIAKLISEQIPELSKNRSTVIAETEVANSVEGTRYTMYKENGAKRKKWRTVHDSAVRSEHKENEKQGWISIDENFQNGEPRAGFAPRCRCDTDYSFDESGDD